MFPFPQERQHEVNHGRILLDSRYPNLLLTPPSTQPGLNSQPASEIRVTTSNWQVPPSRRTVGQRRRQECERAARQQPASTLRDLPNDVGASGPPQQGNILTYSRQRITYSLPTSIVEVQPNVRRAVGNLSTPQPTPRQHAARQEGNLALPTPLDTQHLGANDDRGIFHLK